MVHIFEKKYYLEWIHIVIMSFVFVAASYFFCYLLKSISLAIIPSFIYMMATVTEINPKLSLISYFEYSGMTMDQLFSKYNYFLVVAIIFMIFGLLLNKHYDDYNL